VNAIRAGADAVVQPHSIWGLPRRARHTALRAAGRAVAALTAAAVVAGCTGSGDTGQAGSTVHPPDRTIISAPTAPGTASRADGAERAAAAAAYRAFWPVAATFAHQPQAQWRALLGRVATDPQLGYTLAANLQQRRTGAGIYGQTVPGSPTVRLAGDGRATVTDCADFSHTGKLDNHGNKRTVGLARTPLSVAMRKGTDRAWRVAQITFPAGRC
jgi:hypothetical protein